jgi:carboxyl-terminal processing protease
LATFRHVPSWLLGTVLSLGILSLPLPLHAATDGQSASFLELRRQAKEFEKQGDWIRACEIYEQILGKHRQRTDIKEQYLTCLRHCQQLQRHQDATYRRQIATLSLTQALDIYGDILARLRSAYVDRDRTDPGALFQQGLDELRFALEDAGFRQDFLPGVDAEAVRDFREQLGPTWGNRPLRRPADAQALVREVALAAHKTLGIKPVLVVLEFGSGACSGLDEYTLYVPPGKYAELCASLRGETVGIGMEVAKENNLLLVSQVLPGSPAALAGIKAGDRLLRLGNKSAAGLTAEAAAELLRGEAGTALEVQVLPAGESTSRTLKLVRDRVAIPSVSEPQFLGDRTAGIGYLQLVSFQESTVRELDDALAKLQMAGMRALLLDLRGNPGGLVDAAVGVVERFISAGVIAYTRGQLREYNRTHEANHGVAMQVPLVVLIDGETSSAAEMVAGALKDHGRATLVGQMTFGKGTIQRYWRLTAAPAGLRLTVAKFFSPRGHAYNGIGVTPHVEVERSALDWSMDLEQDPQVRAALEAAGRLLTER